MKFNPFFLFKLLFVLIISLATVSFLVDIHPAFALPRNSYYCYGCYVIDADGKVHCCSDSEPRPDSLSLQRKLNDLDLSAQEKFTEAESQLKQFLEQKKSTRDLSGRAVAHQALGDLYTIMNKPDLASSQLMNAKALYQALENSQGVSQVEAQLQEIQSQPIQIQPQPIEAPVRQLRGIPTEQLLRKTQAPQIQLQQR